MILGSGVFQKVQQAFPILLLLVQVTVIPLFLTTCAASGCNYGCSPDKGHGYSLHRCSGGLTSRRSCRFRNLYYNLDTNEFEYHHCPFAPPQAVRFGRRDTFDSFQIDDPPPDDYFLNTPFLTFGESCSYNRPLLPGDAPIAPVRIRNVRADAAAQGAGGRKGGGRSAAAFSPELVAAATLNATSLDLSGLVVFWAGCCGSLGWPSFGHFLLQSWFPLFLTLRDLDSLDAVTSARVQLQLVPDQPLTHYKHYAAPMGLLGAEAGSAGVATWTDTLARARATGRRYLRLCDVVIGSGGNIDSASYGKYSAFATVASASANWRQFRRTSYQALARAYEIERAGGDAAAGASTESRGASRELSRCARPYVLVNRKRNDKRRILNPAEVVECIKQSLPADVFVGAAAAAVGGKVGGTRLRVVEADFMDSDARTQMKMLACTALLVTTQGSSAFRVAWLPPGSAAIIIGTPDREGLKDPLGIEVPFHEFANHFQMSTVDWLFYPVHANWTGEYELARQHPDPRWQHYNADVRVVCSRLAPLVRQALWGVSARSSWLGPASGLDLPQQHEV